MHPRLSALFYLGLIGTLPPYSLARTTAASYGDLARTTVFPAFKKVQTMLAGISKRSLPHEVKQARKDLLELRDMLDLFVYAFPMGKNRDPWADLRREIKNGYSALGHYKDLFDRQRVVVKTPDRANYDPEEIKTHRNLVLRWTANFGGALRKCDYTTYLRYPLEDVTTTRSPGKLSQFFWAGVDLEPDVRQTGLENLAKLASLLVQKSAGEYANLVEHETLNKRRDFKEFHKFRKRLRSIVMIWKKFPAIIDLENPGRYQEILTELTSAYGKIEDRIVAFEALSKKKAAGRKGSKILEEIRLAWNDLKDQQEEIHLSQIFAELEQLTLN